MARTVSLFLVARDTMTKTLKKAGGALDNFSQKMSKLDGVALAAGGAVGAALAVGMSKALDISAAQGKLQAQLGLTAKESQRIGNVAGKLFADGLGDSMETVNGAVKSVIQNMDGMRKASSATLTATAKRAMNVATIMDEDVSRVTAAVAQMMRTGLAKNSKQAFDIITRGAQLGADKSQDLLDTFNEYGTQFRKMGLSGKQALGLITQGLQAGARDADTVADAIKEFAIRAVDGSKSTAEGFQAIGLSAGTMAARIGKGGKSSAQALDLTLEKLRGIKDPVERSQAAVALFGTKAEDLGEALYALDPSAAVDALGKVGGAADRAGDAMANTAAARIERFKRALQAGLTDFIGNTVLPVLESLEKRLKSLGISPTALLAAGAAVAGLVIGLKVLAVTITTVKTAVAGLTAAWKVINLVMKGGPLGWILIAIGLLVAGLVLAYQKSETFRNIVQAAWAGIQKVVSTAWNSYIKPALEALRAFLVNEVIPRVLFLWNNVFKPVFSDIGALISTIWNGVIKPALTALWTFIKTQVGPAITWLYENAVKPAFRFIGMIIGEVWNGVIKPLLQAWWSYISKILVPVIMFLWKNVVVPVFKAIGAIIAWAWNTIIQPLFKAWWAYISKVLAPIILWIWKNIVSPAFKAIGSIISTIWNGAIKPAFASLRDGVDKVAKAFKGAADFIKSAWKKIESAAKVPIKFVVNTVLNNGILKAWNFVADKFNLSPKGLKINLPQGFAQGGVLPGYSRTDDQLIMARSGEGILVPEAVRSLGEDFIHRANSLKGNAAKLLGVAGDPGGLGLPGFQDGGIVGGIKAFFGKAKDWFLDGVKNATKLVTEPILRAIEGGMGGSPFGQMLGGVPRRIVNGFLNWIDGKEDAISAGGGGVGGKAVAAARKQIGMPYSWGGGGPHGPSYGIGRGAHTYGFDCSGLTEYAWYQATKRSIGGTTYSQKNVLRRVGTPRPGDVGQPHPGHTYLMSAPGRLIEAPYTGAHVREVPMRSTGWWGRPPWVMDTGGVLPPGLNPPIYNGTGGPEYVLRPDQLAEARKVVIELDVTGGEDEFVKFFRKIIRVRGGNVQVAMGRRGA